MQSRPERLLKPVQNGKVIKILSTSFLLQRKLCTFSLVFMPPKIFHVTIDFNKLASHSKSAGASEKSKCMRIASRSVLMSPIES